MLHRRVILALAGAAMLLAGCLPGHQRTSTRELFPADSLSRQLAEATPEQSLELIWRSHLPAEVRYPVTLTWEGDRIFVADLQRGGLHTLSDGGDYVGGFTHEALEFPLIAGAAGDTVAVLSRGNGSVHLVALGDGSDPHISASIALPRGQNLQASWHHGRTFAKVADEAEGSAIFEVGDDGTVLGVYPLPGPFWSHIGFLRTWGDSLVSLGGYRPVVRMLEKGSPPGTTADSLFLMGLDSPQLERSRQFVLGEIREPPLLVPSAAAAGERLFVLNARPGWTHIDVFQRGEAALILEAPLLSPEPGIGQNFFAPDLAVRPSPAGYDLLVLETRPRPAVVRYRWNVERWAVKR